MARRLLLIFAAGTLLYAQLSAPGGGGSTRTAATQLPASGRSQPGSVETSESASPSGGVGTVNSSVSVSGNFAGSVPASGVAAGPISLTLADAVKRGLAANLGPLSAGNSARTARAIRLQELSALLPNFSAQVSETVTQVNLAAYGFQFTPPPGSSFSIPSVVGPFAYSSASATFSQSVWDPVQRRNWSAAKESERASILNAANARELVVLAVGGTYLQTLATAAEIDSQRAQVANAQAVYDQAVTRKTAGTNARIDVTRSLVELQTEQQRLQALEADLRKQKISLARIIGLPQDRELNLTETLAFPSTAPPDVAVELQQAFAHRPDLRAAEAQVKAAEVALSAAHGERLPSLSVNGDYGVLGPNPAHTHGVFAVTGALNVPIWQGGRVQADVEQANSTLSQRRAELADQKAHVEQDVRNALIELEAAAGQVRLAETNRDYARETLTEARDRFGAGVSTTLEVVQAQQQVAAAANAYTYSLFSFDLAGLSLARATGQAEIATPELLKDPRP